MVVAAIYGFCNSTNLPHVAHFSDNATYLLQGQTQTQHKLLLICT